MADEQQQAPQQQFAVQRIYIKDVSFEAPMGAEAFTKQWKPQTKVDLNVRNNKIDDENFEVVLTITLTAELEGEAAFLIEVQQAGVFMLRGFDDDTRRHVLGVSCPNLLFPYARETIDTLAVKGTFPPVMMQPVNFEGLYQQALKQNEQKEH